MLSYSSGRYGPTACGTCLTTVRPIVSSQEDNECRCSHMMIADGARRYRKKIQSSIRLTRYRAIARGTLGIRWSATQSRKQLDCLGAARAPSEPGHRLVYLAIRRLAGSMVENIESRMMC